METDKILKAKELSFLKHDRPSESQRYGTKPYSVHLEMVVDIALKYIYYIKEEYVEDILTSCYCHDIVEDTEITPNDLKKLFGEMVADIVLRVSNERGWDKKEILFKTLPKIWQNDMAIFVKLCDRISNGTNSKNEDSDKAIRSYKRYKMEYPIFRYALKKGNMYLDMWNELDSIFDFSE